MVTADLHRIVSFCDRELRTEGFPDYKGAANGLQVENSGKIRKIAAAVDASFATATLAAEAGASLLIVHHGLFWGASHPWTGRRYQLIRLLLEKDLAIYSSHLPLDAHPRLGNNAVLGRKAGLGKFQPFYCFEGRPIGLKTESKIPRTGLQGRLARVLGRDPILVPGGPEICRKIGIITGGAGGEIARIASEGIDTLITGEGPHWSYALAEDLGVNIFYGGHYATETFGVAALAGHLSAKFGIPWSFVDHPTGL